MNKLINLLINKKKKQYWNEESALKAELVRK